MKQSCKSAKNAEKRSGNHIEYADGITIYAIVRDTGKGPTNLAHSSGSYIIATIKNLSRFMDVTYPSDGYDIGAYRVYRFLFFLRKQKRKQLIYSAAISIAARSCPWHENSSSRRIRNAFKWWDTSWNAVVHPHLLGFQTDRPSEGCFPPFVFRSWIQALLEQPYWSLFTIQWSFLMDAWIFDAKWIINWWAICQNMSD